MNAVGNVHSPKVSIFASLIDTNKQSCVRVTPIHLFKTFPEYRHNYIKLFKEIDHVSSIVHLIKINQLYQFTTNITFTTSN